jgi:low affinity Fe/Cu permease
MSLFDQYAIKARYIPAMIVAVPLILVTSIAPPESYRELFRYSDQFTIVANVGLNVVCVVLLINIIREIGKTLIAKPLFKNGLHAPTTEALLWKTFHMSSARKALLHTKIKKDLSIELLSAEDEAENETEARLRIRDAVAQVRYATENGQHTLQYNIRYGFWRNLAGGLPLAILFSILALIFVSGVLAKVIAGAYLLSALVLAVLVVPLLRATGQTYAEYLFTEYLGGDK